MLFVGSPCSSSELSPMSSSSLVGSLPMSSNPNLDGGLLSLPREVV
jgi:hypothetical protein